MPQAHSRTGTRGFVGGFLIMMILDVALDRAACQKGNLRCLIGKSLL